MFTQNMFYCVGAFLNMNLNDVKDKKIAQCPVSILIQDYSKLFSGF